MTEPRTLKRLLLAMLSFYIAWQAQNRLNGPINSDGLILYGIAIVLFVAAFRRARMTRPAARSPADAAPAGGIPRARRFWALFYFSLLLTLLALIAFLRADLGMLGWVLHLLSVFSLILAFALIKDDRRRTADGRYVLPARNGSAAVCGLRSAVQPILPLVLLMALALLVRVWQNDKMPEGLWFDEARVGLEARQIVNDPSYRPVYIEFVERPAHFMYLAAIAFNLFGDGVAALRLVPALFGTLNVLMAYLLFRRWLGTSGGLVAAALMAFMRYDLTFSRITFDGNSTPFFIMLVLYFLDRGLVRKHLSDFAFAGIALGLGLAFYLSFRIFFVLLIVLGLVLVLATLWRDRAWTRVKFFVPHLLFAALGAFIALSPVLEFAVREPSVFFQRTSSASIFTIRDEPDLAKAMGSNALKHLGMFNLLGDRNGRHNLPGEPMLDSISGVLFILGLSLALVRWRELPNLVMLGVFIGMLQGGILSLDFEAPQALRSIGVVPALIYFVTLPLAMIHAEWKRIFKRPTSNIQLPASNFQLRTLDFGLAVLLVVIAFLNLNTYFNRQVTDPSAWAAHSIGETLAAKEMQRLADTHDFILTSLYVNHPTVHFIAPNVTAYQQWTVNDRLPLVREVSRDVSLLLDPLLTASYDSARLYYPSARSREFTLPSGGPPVLYEVELALNDLQSARGVVARYFNGKTFEGTPAKEEAIPQIALDWTQAPPLNGTFSAEFRSTLFADTYGRYQFNARVSPPSQTLPRAAGEGAVTLLIDENPVSDAPITLAKGNHTLRMRVVSDTNNVELWWQRPDTPEFQLVPASVLFRPSITNSGLLGTYYRSPDWSGDPAFAQLDPEIALYFHDIALPRPYSVEWKGKVFAPTAGAYRFATESIDDSQVAINSRIVVTNPGRTMADGVAQLAPGWNDIVVRFADKTSHTHIYFYWTPPNGQREIVPSRYLSPPMGQYPTAAEIAARPRPLPLPEQPANSATAPPLPPPAGAFNLTHVRTIGEPGQFDEPHAVAVGEDGRIFVADTGNKRVQILDETGQSIKAIEGGAEKFVEPFALVVASSGELIVLDSAEGWLYRFDQDGRSLGRMAGPSAQFYRPRGLFIDAQDNLYVADTGGSRIVKLSPDGQRLQVFGTKGTGKGQFMEPSAAAIDNLGVLFATDMPGKRIEAFSADGRFLYDFPIPLASPYNGPHIVFAPDQTLLVTAPEPHKIQRYARDGRLLGEWGGPSQFRLPTGITRDGNTLWIADTGNNRIQQWQVETNP